MATERAHVPTSDCWNVEALFADFKTWQEGFDKIALSAKPRWPEIAEFKEELKNGHPETVKVLFDLYFAIDRLLSLFYTYAHLRHDEDIANEAFKTAYGRVTALLYDFGEETAWIEPILIGLRQELLDGLLASPLLKDYHFYLEKIIRVKKHMLAPEQEQLIARAGKAMQTSQKSFEALNDADFKFPPAATAEGEKREVTHALYGLYLRDPDRVLRQNAFLSLHGKYAEYENTLCEVLQGQAQIHFFNAQIRGYDSCLDAALYPKNIDTAVYHALIEAVSTGIGALHKYVGLRQRIMKVDTLHPYDMYVPLVPNVDMRIPYDEAESLIIESVAPLGSEYQNMLACGLKDQRWVDRYENENKRSGAYSGGCYDSMPYILMNYKGILKDVFTLAHEAGHSMHSLLTHMHQPYQYGHYPIFVAEVASTFNEELLMQLLLKRETNRERKIFLLNEKIEDIRGTLFRQTMFAEFELLLHRLVESETPLTPQLLKSEYRKLNQKYFGPSVCIDSLAEIEWARIPHFYYNFYVYQYATGISASLALADRVTQGGIAERNAYLDFLKGGCSRYPIDLLRLAGVDMHSPDPVQAAINKFSSLVDELDTLLS
jgi:oligoendopeptidase F